jgi:hypothetical protein
MFDPSRAGVEALVAALEAKEEREEADEEDEAESPPASTPDPAIPPPRLAPLSRWAFAGETSTEPGVPRPHQRDDLRDLLDGLAVPANVVSVSYPTGCLIRRVRMVREPGAKRKKGQQGEPVIIVSRRALGHGVSGKDDSGPTLP